jgi:hypothetical protein
MMAHTIPFPIWGIIGPPPFPFSIWNAFGGEEVRVRVRVRVRGGEEVTHSEGRVWVWG